LKDPFLSLLISIFYQLFHPGSNCFVWNKCDSFPFSYQSYPFELFYIVKLLFFQRSNIDINNILPAFDVLTALAFILW